MSVEGCRVNDASPGYDRRFEDAGVVCHSSSVVWLLRRGVRSPSSRSAAVWVALCV